MKNYINLHTKKRTKATNRFKKMFFKLMINPVYGKAMENLKKRISAKRRNNEKDYLKHVSKPTFISPKKKMIKILLLFMKKKTVLTLTKPIYVEFAVLELSKWLIYDFHYNFYVSK